ncbi:MAG: dihydroorotase [Solirubrobacteraceae bacterium]
MTHELGIEGGTVVTATGRARLHVYADGGRVTRLSAAVQPARRRVDAGGLLVMPGMIDAHVHLMDPAEPEREDFPTGTAAAARAGVTTVVEHTHGGPVRTAEELAAKREHVDDRARVDFALAAHVWPEHLDEIPALWRAGVAYFKAFTCTTHGVPGLDAALLAEAFRRIAAVDGVCLAHCEDESLTAHAEHALREAARADGGIVPAWRSREAELTAVAVAGLLARCTGVELVIAHVSHLAVLEQVEHERAAGARVAAETCPQYLTLLEDEALEQGALRKFTPPARARSRAELDDMWRAVADARFDLVSSDHAPSTRVQKIAGSVWEAPFGLPGLDTTFAILLDAAHAGRLSYERVVELYATAPVRRYGLHPRKGRLEPGADADIVLVDPERRWTVRDEDVVSRAGWSPFAGRTLVGGAVQTYLRGELVASEGHVPAEPGTGRFVPGRGAAIVEQGAPA